MKKITILAMLLAITGFISGCTSAPKQCNLSGTWNYTFEETGRDGVQTGSMKLVQQNYALTGDSNDAFGEFAVTGVVESSKFTLNGKRNDGKRSYRLNATLINDNEFDGVYTTDQNTSGTMKGHRVTAR